MWRLRAAVAAALLPAAPTVAEAKAEGATGACRLGRVVAERTLLSPKPRTFYSVDALNPDVVRRDGTYYLFFSGNRVHTAGGDWRTGVATGPSPLGPFRVRRWLRGDFLNGGTVVWRRRFWQAYTHNRRGGELAVSRTARRWRPAASIPEFAGRGWPLSADYHLARIRGGLRLYMLARRALVGFGGSLASVDWVGGRWRRFRVLLSPGSRTWESADLGEPATLRLRHRHLLLYTATSRDGRRSIGLARSAGGRWRRCGSRPVIGRGAPWGGAASIDPSSVREGNRVFVYYGGGQRNSIAADLGGAIGVRVYELTRPARARSRTAGPATRWKKASSSSIRLSQR